MVRSVIVERLRGEEQVPKAQRIRNIDLWCRKEFDGRYPSLMIKLQKLVDPSKIGNFAWDADRLEWFRCV